jgi:hypothetical protein
MSPGGSIKLVSIASPQRTFSLRVTSMQARVTMVWSDGMPLGLFRGRDEVITIEKASEARGHAAHP